tara:strand:+ start:452 stop:700 length:249 start_codon:yes stop_codon:yes gene_type:complete
MDITREQYEQEAQEHGYQLRLISEFADLVNGVGVNPTLAQLRHDNPRAWKEVKHYFTRIPVECLHDAHVKERTRYVDWWGDC